MRSRLDVRNVGTIVLGFGLLLSACSTSSQQTENQTSTARNSPVAVAPTVTIASYPAPSIAGSTPAVLLPSVEAYPAPTTQSGALPSMTTIPTQFTSEATLTPEVQRRLLREVWPQAPTSAPLATYLLYSRTITATDATQRTTNVFVQVDLRDLSKQQTFMNVSGENPFLGQISPRYDWLVYRTDRPNEKVALHIARLDGSDDHMVSEGLLAPAADLYEFAWSSDGRLALNKYRDPKQGGNEFYVYNVDDNLMSRKVFEGERLQLIGWQDVTHILALSYKDTIHIELINVDTGSSEPLIDLPVQKFVNSIILSPDKEKLFLNIDSNAYLFDMSSRQLTVITVSDQHPVWSVDSNSLLGFTNQSAGGIQLTSIQKNTTVTLDLIPSPPSPTSFNIESASPDGKYLVICESQPALKSRTLLYDIASDRLQALVEGQYCVNIFGWLPETP
jgi:hypothetical protein